jgi:hypothetical protein
VARAWAPTPYLGPDDEPLLDGFEAHREVFDALEPVRVPIPLSAATVA